MHAGTKGAVTTSERVSAQVGRVSGQPGRLSLIYKGKGKLSRDGGSSC